MLSYALLAAASLSIAAAKPVRWDAVASPVTLAPLYTPPAPPSSFGAESSSADGAESHIIQDSYIVVLKDHVEPAHVVAHHAHIEAVHAADRVHALKARSIDYLGEDDEHGINHKYHVGKHGENGRKMLKGYSGKFSEHTLEAIRTHDAVKYVEKDSIVWASEVEKGAPWGLARISNRKPLNLGTFSRYSFDGHGGEGVTAYVIDTGVNIDHKEFGGRAKWGKTIPKDADRDLNGHGSHVAGTIASSRYGVAKQATIVAVKVLGAGGSGSMSDVIAGVEFASTAALKDMEAHLAGKNPKHKGSVANMSLGGGKSQALDDAVDAAVEDGLHFAVAAGNDNKDACSYSPASSELAITVGASTIGDERAYFSNHGKCVDIFGPGLNIVSIWNTGNTSVNTISGTSMASPHVAGLAAYFLSLYPTSFLLAEDDFEEAVYSALFDESPAPSYLRSGAQIVFGKLQQWSFGAPKKSVRDATKSKTGLKPLTPKALKKAMIKVATKGVLTDLPSGTPNFLINNNFTETAIAMQKEFQY